MSDLTGREKLMILAAIIYIICAAVVDCGPEPITNDEPAKLNFGRIWTES